jgi:hypothetical protein
MVLDEVAAFLAAASPSPSLGTVGTTIFKAQSPDSPDACIIVYEYGGFAPLHTFGSDHTITRPRVQIVCRGEPDDYVTPRTTAKNVYQKMHFGKSTLSSTSYFRAEAISEPFPLENDENGRHLIACNYHIEKEFS